MEQSTTSRPQSYPCVVCGTTGGYVAPGASTPERTRGACKSCYGRFRHSGRLDELLPPTESVDARGFLDRLLAGEVEPDGSGCILWPGATNTGYGVINVDGTVVRVTRVVLEHAVGPPPTPDHEAAHAPHDVCGNTDCVNVAHLRWATRRENELDRITDGTSNRGERQGGSKLTARQVLEIREEHARGDMTNQEIGDRYGVTRHTVGMIGRRQSWRHLPEAAPAQPDTEPALPGSNGE